VQRLEDSLFTKEDAKEMKVLIAYRKQKRNKLLLRVFVNRLMIFIYKIIIGVSENRRNSDLR